MSDVCGARKAVLARGLGAVLVVLGLSACAPEPETTQHVTYLPASTPRVNAPAERARQLSTGTHRDDIPEYTGAPSPRTGTWPAPVPERRKTAYRDDYVTYVQ
ncbi:hypothetical protein [Tropicimonas aquimaris]|uniref:Lipoprotein n=1 Tax=Tropicimonas aquimaris TaxID=914152 RepID=A0ABW3IXK2_9RHOB